MSNPPVPQPGPALPKPNLYTEFLPDAFKVQGSLKTPQEKELLDSFVKDPYGTLYNACFHTPSVPGDFSPGFLFSTAQAFKTGLMRQPLETGSLPDFTLDEQAKETLLLSIPFAYGDHYFTGE